METLLLFYAAIIIGALFGAKLGCKDKDMDTENRIFHDINISPPHTHTLHYW